MDINLLLDAIFKITSSSNIFLLIGSVISGIIVGAAPGLTSTMAIGLLMPLTFSFEKGPAFILLLGIYCGAMYGGSITAILMNLPGTPTAAVTAIEGYPLTVKGEGGKAIGIATISSTLGGLISCIFLIFLSLKLSKLAIVFSNPEYFSLGLFATVVVFSLAGESPIKGLIAASLGLLLSTIGLDVIRPFPRFTFGSEILLIGIPAVPAIIGMFCVGEAFRMAEDTRAITKLHKEVSGFLLALKSIPSLWLTIVKSAFIGVIIGILPGTGATMASFIAYSESKRVSKHPERYGKGVIEGVCASEAANNGVTGGALIPALTLGIPGDTSTLMLLGAMLIHGLIPGPTLFRDEIDLVYLIFGTMIIANILILPLGLSLSNYISRIALIEKKYLMPIIAVVAITGASIGYGHIYYLWISIIFGFLGYLMKKGDFPILATAMTLILGPIMEKNLRSALMLPHAGIKMFLTRPICLGFFVLSGIVLFFTFMKERKKYSKN